MAPADLDALPRQILFGLCRPAFAGTQSSHHTGRLQGTQLEAAPGGKAGSKMRTSTHFDSGGRLVQQQAQQQQARSSGGGSGKTGMGLAMGSNGFGAKSSKGQGGAAFNMSSLEQDLSGIEGADVVVGRGGGNLSESALKGAQQFEPGGGGCWR